MRQERDYGDVLPQCTWCSPHRSRSDTVRSWSSANRGVEAVMASCGRKDHRGDSRRSYRRSQKNATQVDLISALSKCYNSYSICFKFSFLRPSDRFQSLFCLRVAINLLKIKGTVCLFLTWGSDPALACYIWTSGSGGRQLAQVAPWCCPCAPRLHSGSPGHRAPSPAYEGRGRFFFSSSCGH